MINKIYNKIVSTAYAQDVFGNISNPLQDGYGDYNNPNGGLVGFLSNIVKTLTIVAGIWTFFNLLLAGFDFITASGDPEKIQNAWQKIFNSLLGLVIIVASFTIAALLGWLIFKDATAILQPKIYGPGI